MVTHLKQMAEFGYGYSRKEVLDIATDYATMLGKKNKEDPAMSMNWFMAFWGDGLISVLLRRVLLKYLEQRLQTCQVLQNILMS